VDRSSRRTSSGARSRTSGANRDRVPDFKLLDDRNVFENVAITCASTGRRTRTSRKGHASAHAGRALPQALRPADHALGGEQQRWRSPRGGQHPEILLADEPTGNLDPEVTKDILQLILRINSSGTGSHGDAQPRARPELRSADRLLRDGTIEEDLRLGWPRSRGSLGAFGTARRTPAGSSGELGITLERPSASLSGVGGIQHAGAAQGGDVPLGRHHELTLLVLAVFLLATDNVLTFLDRARREMTSSSISKTSFPRSHRRRIQAPRQPERGGNRGVHLEEQAMAEFREELGDQRSILEVLETNPLPHRSA